MSEESLISNLVGAVERLNAAGDCWGWSHVEIAKLAIRRWATFDRRHPKAKQITNADRVLDLAKGLQSHFEPEIPYTHPSDWRALATALSDAMHTNKN